MSASGPAWTAEQIQTACSAPLHPAALRGLQDFNARHFFEAHDALEIAWRAERGPMRDVYRGILQIGLAYYHTLRQNYPGAVKMFVRWHEWLDPFPDECNGIDLAGLRRDALLAEAELLRLGPEHIHEFKTTLIRPITYQTDRQYLD